MKSGRRTGVVRTCGAAAIAAGLLLATAGEARADDTEFKVLAGALVGFAAADITFAVHDLDAAGKNRLDRDGWLIAETVVSVPQTLVFNSFLLAMNTDPDTDFGDIATVLGVLPTAGVTALSIHGIWGLTEDRPPADAHAGVSVLAGMNFTLSMAAIGRATGGSFHTRGIGVLELVLAAPGLAVGIYESTFERPQQGAWIGLTAWSGGLVAHGVLSAIIDGRIRSSDPAPENPGLPPVDARKAASRAHGPFGLATFSMAPTVLSNGATQVPGVTAVGTF